MMKKRRLTYCASVSIMLIAVFLALSTPAGANQSSVPARAALENTALGQQSPDSSVDMDTFLKAAVPCLTFEHGQDPLCVARKQSFVKAELSGPLRRDDVGDASSVIRHTHLRCRAHLPGVV